MKSEVWGHRSGQRQQLKFSVNIIYLFGLVLPHNFWNTPICLPFSIKEIHVAVSLLGDDKSLSVDDFSSEF